MTTRRGFLRGAAGAGIASAVLGCQAQEPTFTSKEDPDGSQLAQQFAHYKAALVLREAGLFIFERRCWAVSIEEDGRQYGYGCGSYFRWLYPGRSSCPFCRREWEMITFSWGDPILPQMDSIYPLTLNYTGEPGKLNEFEFPIWNYERKEGQLTDGGRES